MGSRSFNKYFPVTILNGQVNSPWIGCDQYEDMVALLVEAPAALAETITFQLNTKRDGTGVSSTLQDDTPVDVVGPVAGKARFYNQLLHAVAFRLVASGAVGGDRAFQCSGQWTA